MKYEVVIGETLHALEEAMNKKLQYGYLPLGGVAVRPGGIWAQAIIRDEDSAERNGLTEASRQSNR